jgi:hypothetical protein
VRRQIYSDRLTQPVVVDSVYDRAVASATSGEFIVRDGETLVAILNDDLTTKLSRQGDLFTIIGAIAGGGKGAAIGGIIWRCRRSRYSFYSG